MQLCRDGTAVGLFLSRHDDEIFAVEQNAEIVLCDELPGLGSHIHPVLRFPVWISIRPDDELGNSVNKAFMPCVTVPDSGPVWNAHPCGFGS